MTSPRHRPFMLALSLAISALACGDTRRDTPDASLDIGQLLGGTDTLHARATEVREFAFPRDHGPHPDFRTEWWYFTGNLTSEDGRELGYQLTFFRNALLDSTSYLRSSLTGHDPSPWRTRHAFMAHFAVTDARDARFHSAETFARAAVGLAGAQSDPWHVWLGDWSAESLSTSATFPVRLRAHAGDIAIDLILEQGGPVVLQGDRGLSRKGAEPGNASYYYSLTRMPTHGVVTTRAGAHRVTGESWLDREWSTSVLPAGVTGWDWMSLQLDDDTEVTLYRLRRGDGTVDPFSAATLVTVGDTTIAFAADEFAMTPTRMWRAADDVEYPVAWRVILPAQDLTIDVVAAIDDQELLHAVRYWEGMVRASGVRAGQPVSGRGYLEMTGYAGTPGPGR